jgi:hypothetical protein
MKSSKRKKHSLAGTIQRRIQKEEKTEMNSVTEVKTDPNAAPKSAIVNGGAAAATASAFSFPIGYHDLNPDIDINFQLNRFYGWVGDDSMLTEMRETVAGVNDYPTFTKIILDLGEKALARHEVRKGAYYLRLAEFFMFTIDPRKLPIRVMPGVHFDKALSAVIVAAVMELAKFAPVLLIQLYFVLLRGGFDAFPGGIAFSIGHPLHLLEAGDRVAHVSGVVDRFFALLWESEVFVGDMIAASFSDLGHASR